MSLEYDATYEVARTPVDTSRIEVLVFTQKQQAKVEGLEEDARKWPREQLLFALPLEGCMSLTPQGSSLPDAGLMGFWCDCVAPSPPPE